MPIGSKQKYTDQQQQKAEHIEAGYQEKGVAHEKAEQIAWANALGPQTLARQLERQPLERQPLERQPLEDQPLATLRAKARKKHISGRSSMSKVELIQALRRSR